MASLYPLIHASLASSSAETVRGVLRHDGHERTYRLFDPEPDGDALRPLVLLLHGGGGSGEKIARISRFEALAAREGLLTVSPDGIGGSWNDGRPEADGAEDAGFLLALASELMRSHRADPARFYVAGASNGGMMAMRLAHEAGDRIAAVAPVMAALPEALASRFRPPVPVPAVFINGDEDPVLPFHGGEIRIQRQRRGRVLSVAETVARWAGHNGAAGEPERDTLPGPEDAAMRVRWERHPAPRAETLLYIVEGGGHTWPGGEQYMPEWLIGKTCQHFDANVAIWAFLKRWRSA